MQSEVADGGVAVRWTGRIAGFGLLIISAVAAQARLGHSEDTGPPSVSGIRPEFHDGDPTCSNLAPADAEWRFELEADAPTTGTLTDGRLQVEITLRDTPDGPTLGWTSNTGVDAVFIRGDSGGNLYNYDAARETTGDSALHAPIEDRGGTFSGVSHVSFC
jgi:hypothetical protein